MATLGAATAAYVNKAASDPTYPGLAADLVTKADVAQEAWHTIGASGEPAFANSWVSYGAGDEPAYYKDSLGEVHLDGLMKDGTVGLAAFTLPAGYRPAKTQRKAANANEAFGNINISAAGVVTVTTGNNAYVSLSGITFRAS